MKTTIIFALLTLTLSAQAGVCRLDVASHESGKLPFAGGGNKEKIDRVALDECARFAEEKLGSTVVMSTLIRRERRLVTSVSFEYSDGKLHSSGKLNLKAKH